jgi:hypothetical protein
MTNRYFIFFISWLFPGAGHLIQKKYVKGAIFVTGIVSLLLLGVIMKGKFFDTKEMHPLLLLGFFGDVGSGIFYFIIDKMGVARESTNIAYVTYHYGTTYLVTAGLLNYLIALNAFDIAKKRGKK